MAALIEPRTTQIIRSDEGDTLGWLVLWLGVPHGGRHYRVADAIEHAVELEAAPEWDRSQWVAKHRAALAEVLA